jgi:hypothetical protein
MSAPKSDKSGVKKTYRALVKAGYTIVVVDGAGEEFTNLTTEAEVIKEVMSCCDGYFVAYKDGQRIGFVWFVYGNSPEEVVSDCSVSLSHIIDPLTESWWN